MAIDREEKEARAMLSAIKAYRTKHPEASAAEVASFIESLSDRSFPKDADSLEKFEEYQRDTFAKMQEMAELWNVSKNSFLVTVLAGNGESFKIATGNPVVITFYGKPDRTRMMHAMKAIRRFYCESALEKPSKLYEFNHETRKVKKLAETPSAQEVAEIYDLLSPKDVVVDCDVTYTMTHKPTGEKVTLTLREQPMVNMNVWNAMMQMLDQKVIANHSE